MKIRNSLLLIAFAMLAISSCKKSSGPSAQEIETTLLAKYIAKYHSTVAPKPSGLYVIETKAAPAGAVALKNGDLVNVFYSGYRIEDNATAGVQDGFKFDSNVTSATPFSFTVGQGKVIAGWDEGFTYMKDGSEAKLIIPSWLGYGDANFSGFIPPYSTLVFYVKVTKP